jgi:hypothetical protein
VGMTAPILHAAQKQSCSVGQQRRAGVKYAIGRIGPIFGGQNWIAVLTVKKREGLIAH